MAGVKVSVTSDVEARLQGLVAGIEHPKPMFALMNEYLGKITRARFKTQTAPDGTPWQELSAKYKARKKKNKNRILTLNNYLGGTLRGVEDDQGLEFGTNRVYAAIHQLGGVIKKKTRRSEVYFRQRADGSVGNRFVKKNRSNFAQSVNVGEHTIKIPAREFLGTNDQQNQHLVKIATRFLKKASEK
ncbi:phage virion morphogenesis protein [Gilvimarinus agarilyticus]|uniref:phage virion morphogenesis protein n=1 Tax=Gilvimarinus agarilyticus TaxID=679259 RepID=UPI00059FE75D|nr:phage virion morphogenesis protein [Gilvimarinus agarilyticus]